MMAYEEFVQSIKLYLNAPMSVSDEIIAAIFLTGALVFAAWFLYYLRKQYIKRKEKLDAFDTSFAKNLEYPGFHPGGVPDNNHEEEKKKPEKDKWGSINEEF